MKYRRWVLAAAGMMLAAPGTGDAQQGRRAMNAEQRATMAARQAEALLVDMRMERPIEALNSVWIEELTWMEVRDALRDGKTTAIISTGGIEQNGPYLATGKHNVVLTGACEGIARKLGNALCGPVLKLVPEGDIDNPSGHMRYPGTISLREETFRAVLDDMASSLRAHGFTDIVFIGDSGGNQAGMAAVAADLNERWRGSARAHFIPEFYRYSEVFEWMESELGIVQTTNDGFHDDFVITAIMMTQDPASVRHGQRLAAGKASINGVSIADKEATIDVGNKLLGFRVDQTVKAIKAATAGGN
ncbi:MAG: creatininase family protein [Gemmatimonadetes bacterium]|nr:creatininase family protein [Gemmatimonadota bacterium]MCY3679670.1 creatininase family protein [Gemmatimonadota bacterium]MYA44165.1 creatininase [Gemmatimonadota bacterium]MYE93982.1 creatininase [Gemmatimonadota bacterium]MYJ11290.1 creatininase [Gemmatimonadota bacterium]